MTKRTEVETKTKRSACERDASRKEGELTLPLSKRSRLRNEADSERDDPGEAELDCLHGEPERENERLLGSSVVH